MYAVLKSGGKQYRVSPGDKIKVERLTDLEGSQIALDEIMLVADGDQVTVGAPHVSNASVQATVLEHGRNPKVRIVKFRRRKHSQKTQGHRHNYTRLEINQINLA